MTLRKRLSSIFEMRRSGGGFEMRDCGEHGRSIRGSGDSRRHLVRWAFLPLPGTPGRGRGRGANAWKGGLRSFREDHVRIRSSVEWRRLKKGSSSPTIGWGERE